ncbi:ABC transporter permease [Bacteroides caecigallinarum]|uniref:ABC transporter permease n=1 Tax=Bacteroides caecigallinarum TaxID=1411144 RepID=UPI001F440A19|nr:ABC transporter permease [Bacteroides caecigallinarum]MCF2593567.1 ABC transporter permease [Bacteroides caecigallinarum]
MKHQPFRNIVRQGFSSLFHICAKELKNVFKDQGVLIFFILVPLAYPLVYAFIYTEEVVRDVPAAVVDNSRSSMSREFIRMVDATPDVRIQSYCADMEEAQNLIKEGRVYGIIYIPEEFARNISQGKQVSVSIFSDMSGLLYYKSLLMATTNVSLDMNKDIKIRRMGNTTARQDEIGTAPIEYEEVSLFNPQDGFASFLIPAVLILIIQQTLLLGIGLSAGTARETNRYQDLVPLSRKYNGTLRIVLGKSLAYFLIYAMISAYVLCAIPKMFSLVQIANPVTLLVFTLPYILACIFFAMTCSIFIHHRESCMMIYVFTSVPLLFISGISWPGAAIPDFWKVVSWIFPSTFGINGFVRINSMGATLADVLPEFRALWIHTGIYFITTCIVYRRQIQISHRHVEEKLKKVRKYFRLTKKENIIQ